MSKRLIISIFVVLLCSSCSHRQSVEKQKVEIAQDLFFELQPIASDIANQHLLQSLTVSYDDQSKQILVATELNNANLNMVAMSAAGLVLFEITWQYGDLIEVNRSNFAENVSALNILADFQLVTIPLFDLQQTLPNLNITELVHTNRIVRKISDKTKTLITIEYIGQKQVNFIHHQRKYQITIDTLESSSL